MALMKYAVLPSNDCMTNGSQGENKMLIEGFNEAVSKRTITVLSDPDFKASYCGCRVTDGIFEIIFKPKNLGTNSYSACEDWKKVINEGATVIDSGTKMVLDN